MAVLAPISWRVPPPHYGPWELFASLLTEGLVARGHEVTLFATGDSLTAGRLVRWCPPAGRRTHPSIPRWPSVSTSRRSSSGPRVRSDPQQLRLPPADLLGLISIPCDNDPWILVGQIVPSTPSTTPAAPTSPSVKPTETRPGLCRDHSSRIDIDEFRFTEPRDYLAFFGRIHPDKGVAEAIEAAQLAGLPLRMAGIVQDQAYFEQEVVPHLDGTGPLRRSRPDRGPVIVPRGRRSAASPDRL